MSTILSSYMVKPNISIDISASSSQEPGMGGQVVVGAEALGVMGLERREAMIASMDLPWFTAVMEPPLPRWQAIKLRSRTGRPSRLAACWAA